MAVMDRNEIKTEKNIRRSLLMGIKAFMVVLALFLLCGCSKKEEQTAAEQETAAAKELQNYYNFSEEDAAVFQEIQQKLDESETGLAAAYLGDAAALDVELSAEESDAETAQQLLGEVLEKSRHLEDYSFLHQVPYSRVIRTGTGTGLYLVIPDSKAEGLTVYAAALAGDGTVSRGKTAANVYQAFPVLIISGPMVVEEIGGYLGTLELPGDGSVPENCLDISRAPDPVTEAELLGTWQAPGMINDAGTVYDLSLQFEPGGGFSYQYICRSGGPWEDQVILHYSGSWELLGNSRYRLEGTSDGGVYMESGVPAHEVQISCDLSFTDPSHDTLRMEMRDGDVFFQGMQETEVLLSRKTELAQ